MNDRVAHRIAQLAKLAASAPTSPQSTAPNDVDRLLSGLPSRRKKHRKKRKRESRESLKFDLASKTGAEKLAFQDVFAQPPPPEKPPATAPVVLPPGGRGLPADVSNVTPAAKPPAGPPLPPAPVAPQGVTPQAQQQHDKTVEKFRYLTDPKATKPGGTPNTANWQLPTPEQFHRQFGVTYEQAAKQMNVPVSMLPHLLYGTNTDQKGFGPQSGLNSSIAYGDQAGDLSRVQNPNQVGRINFQTVQPGSQYYPPADRLTVDVQGNAIHPALMQQGRGTNDALGLQNNPRGWLDDDGKFQMPDFRGIFSANQDDPFHQRHFQNQGGAPGDPFGRSPHLQPGMESLYAQQLVNAPGWAYNLANKPGNLLTRLQSLRAGTGLTAKNPLFPAQSIVRSFRNVPDSLQAATRTATQLARGGPAVLTEAQQALAAQRQAAGGRQLFSRTRQFLSNIPGFSKLAPAAKTTQTVGQVARTSGAASRVAPGIFGKAMALASPIMEMADAVGGLPQWAGGTGMGNLGWESSKDHDYSIDPYQQGKAGILPEFWGKGPLVASLNASGKPIRNAPQTVGVGLQAAKNWTWDQWDPTWTNPFRSVGGGLEQQRQKSMAANPQYNGPAGWANSSYEHTYPGQQSYNTRQQNLDQIVKDYAGGQRGDKSGNYGAGNQFRDALLQANPDLMNKMESGELDMSHVPSGMLNIPAGYKNPGYSESGQAFRKKYWSDPSKKYMDPEAIRDAEQYEKNVQGGAAARAPLQEKYQAHVESERAADAERFNALSPQDKLKELKGRQTARDSVRQLPPKMTSTIRHHDRSKDPSGFKLSLQDYDRDILGQRGSQLQNLNTLRPGEQYAHGEAATEQTEQTELIKQWLQQQAAPQGSQLADQAK